MVYYNRDQYNQQDTLNVKMHKKIRISTESSPRISIYDGDQILTNADASVNCKFITCTAIEPVWKRQDV